ARSHLPKGGARPQDALGTFVAKPVQRPGSTFGPRSPRLRLWRRRLLFLEPPLVAPVDLLDLRLRDARESDAHRRIRRRAMGPAEIDGVLAEDLVEMVHRLE